jgi:peptidyl-prolyl cis-trans isomerase A (cyclophilin A)
MKHTIFGEVADQASRDVVDAIGVAATNAQDRPLTEILLTHVTIS